MKQIFSLGDHRIRLREIAFSDIYAHMSFSRGCMQLVESENKPSLEKIKKTLGEKHACYVLITCSESSDSGEMSVQMDFEGDEDLAAMLVDNAGQIFNERLSLRQLK